MTASAACTLAASLGLTLAACAEPPRSTGAPSFYTNLGSASARIDAPNARATISAYRLNNGLIVLALDPALNAEAQSVADAMAAADKPASAERIKTALAARGVAGAEVNLSAGYRTFAEAFSGWRESAQHDRVMKAQSATRMGIATAYAPGSKYQVYWALVVAP
jgi:uncharacterized protein YkwD